MSFNSIPKYTDFIKDRDLLSKVPSEVLESYREFLSSDDNISEGIMDNIKNTLSKTLLGGLSYISMIDKGLEGIFLLKKDLIDKSEKAEKEIFELEKKLTTLERSKNPDMVRQTRDKIANIKNALDKEKKVIELKIEQGEKLVEETIKGNKRRREYFEAKESEYALKIAEYELTVAKKKINPDQSEIKELQHDVELAKQEAQRNAEDLKKSAEKEEDSKSSDRSSKIGKKRKTGIHDEIKEVKQEIAERESEVSKKKEALKKKDPSKMSESKKRELERAITKIELDLKFKKAYLKELTKSLNSDESKNASEIKKEVEKEVKNTVEKEVKKESKKSGEKGLSKLTPAQREKSAR